MNIYRSLVGLRNPHAAAPDVDLTEEVTAEADEPPDRVRTLFSSSHAYSKAIPYSIARRESLLTRQLHSETEHSEEDHAPTVQRPSISGSVYSAASTAELTSDDGKSVPSPAISPPLTATFMNTTVPVHAKTLSKKIEIVGQDETRMNKQKDAASEPSIEAGLGRRRFIKFACGNKTEKCKATPPTSAPIVAQPATPPKRKCMIQFVCPNRPSETKPAIAPQTKRPTSPFPPVSLQQQQNSSLSVVTKAHRGSDSTVTHASPRSHRKSPATSTSSPKSTANKQSASSSAVLSSHDVDSDDSGPEATRFHEFATSDAEQEAWTKESTVHRARLTISDTLKKENVIRRACEEVEEEAIEDEEEEDEIDELADSNDLDEEYDDNDDLGHGDVYRIDEESEDSDDGFHSDDEEGFADSDSDDGEGSDYEWWKPGGPSTAATSVEHLDRLTLAPRTEEDDLASSLGSASSGHMSPRTSRQRFHKNAKKHKTTRALSIPNPEPIELPDSTDFVAGTLDEDRPLEQAYIDNIKDRAAAKHRVRPQDIDPTFPTSDPELEDEDDEDLVDASDSDDERMIHGDLDELNGDGTAKPRRSPRPSRRNINRSPPPPAARLRSPPPPTRLHSPPPFKRRTQHASSPPSHHDRVSSPRRLRSPVPTSRKTSPASTRPGSLVTSQHAVSDDSFGLPQRINITHTASLPRGGHLRISTLDPIHSEDERGTESTGTSAVEAPRRGAIDIVKGLERKRQRRKEKLYQKLCAKAAAKGEKAYKVKPGKGAERMREVGLELQRYKGTGEHILSV